MTSPEEEDHINYVLISPTEVLIDGPFPKEDNSDDPVNPMTEERNLLEPDNSVFWTQLTGRDDYPDVTSLFISIVYSPSFQKMFQENRMKKSEVWNEIAQAMEREGYPIPGDKAGSKCNQKQTNLIRGYKRYINRINRKGIGITKPPRYLELLHKHLSKRIDIASSFTHEHLSKRIDIASSFTHKHLSKRIDIAPSFTLSSLSPRLSSVDPSQYSPLINIQNGRSPSSSPPSSPTSSHTFFKKSGKQNSDILAYLKKKAKADQELTEREIAVAEEHNRLLARSADQKDKLIGLLENFLKRNGGRKRRRHSSSDEDY